MSVAEHRSGTASVSCFVLTITDTRRPDTDTSGQAIADLLEAAGHRIAERALVPDEPRLVRTRVQQALADPDTRAVITTGGTGISKRDSTYEALTDLFGKSLPGFGELFRMLSFEAIGPAAMLSRAAAGVADGRVLFLLPGSEHAVRLAMTRLILPELSHIAGELEK